MNDHIPHSLIHVRQYLYNHPWALRPDMLEAIAEIVENHATGQVDAAMVSRFQSNPTPMTVERGIAIVPVEGVIARKMSLMSAMSGGSSQAQIQRDFNSAMKSSADTVALLFDSPGGDAQGVEETADLIYSARAESKLVIGCVMGQCCSAAYWLASQCDMIMASKDSLVGSIGVITKVTDTSRMEKNAGIDTHVIRSGVNKSVGTGPVTDSQLDQIREIAAQMFSSFTAGVERGRDMKLSKDVLSGRIYTGAGAMEAGLVDEIGGMESLFAKYGK